MIDLSATFSRQAVYAITQPQLLYAVIDLLPLSSMAEMRLPLNFCLVLDKSASMRGEPIRCLRQAVQEMISGLQPDDVMAIVTFDNSARLVIPAQAAVDKKAVQCQIETLDAGGGTQMSPGMRSGLQELAQYAGSERLNRMVLFTDGRSTNEKACLKRAAEAEGMGVPIVVLGLGTDWNEDLLQEIAARTGGRADYIAQPEDIRPIFQEVWQRLQVVARNLCLVLHLSDGVEARSVWQVIPEIKNLGLSAAAGRTATVALDELEADGQTIIVELVAPVRRPGLYRLAQAEVSYDVQQLRIRHEKVLTDLTVQYTSDCYVAQRILPRATSLVERITAYRMQQAAIAFVATGDLAGAIQRLGAAASVWQRVGETDLARTCQDEADRLRRQGQLSETGAKTIKFHSAKTRRLDGEI